MLPLLAIAVWSRVWIGWWALLPCLALILWTWANPRIFPPPATTDRWASKGVLGERVWLNRRAVPIPAHHARAANVLSVVSLLGVLPYAYGLFVLGPFETLLGLAVIMLSKLWFLDRMVWLYADMNAQVPEYRRWLY